MTTTKDRLTDAVLGLLRCSYQLPDGTQIKGQSISYLSQELRDLGWKGVSNLNDLEGMLTDLGFKMVKAQGFRWNSSRKPDAPDFKLGTPARVVTL